jgi:uncharacterized membrane protein YphA (DoxX/SURF4 family)
MVNFRHRYLIITIRTLLGALFVFSGVMGLRAGTSMEGIPQPMVATLQTLWATGILQMIKVTEVVAGAMLVCGFLPALAAIFLAPICVGVIIFNVRLAPGYVVSGVVISMLNAYIGYAYWDKYQALFRR